MLRTLVPAVRFLCPQGGVLGGARSSPLGPRTDGTFLRLLAIFALFAGVFAARTASAVTRVPMCGEHAQTVMAPPVSRPLPPSELVASPCEHSGMEGVTSGPPMRPKEPPVASDFVPRLPPVVHHFADASRARSTLDTSENGEQPAHARSIDRPPR